MERLQDATIAISNKVPVMADSLAPLKSLRMIAVCATGTNNVDLEYCRAHGIVVSNIRNYAMHTVPEHVFTLILALRRNLPGYREDVRNGLWQKAEQFCLFTRPILDLHGSTLGVIGHGTLGQATAKLGEAFGMRVLFAEHKGAATVRSGYTAFETVLRGERRDHPALSAHARDPSYDRRAGTPKDAPPCPAHQHRPRRSGG